MLRFCFSALVILSLGSYATESMAIKTAECPQKITALLEDYEPYSDEQLRQEFLKAYDEVSYGDELDDYLFTQANYFAARFVYPSDSPWVSRRGEPRKIRVRAELLKKHRSSCYYASYETGSRMKFFRSGKNNLLRVVVSSKNDTALDLGCNMYPTSYTKEAFKFDTERFTCKMELEDANSGSEFNLKAKVGTVKITLRFEQ